MAKLKVYISASSNAKAQVVRDFLKSAIKGVVITSTWHEAKTDIRQQKLSPDDKEKIALRNCTQITESDILILIADDDRVPGGKFVEAGIALGLGKTVLTYGRRENTPLHHEQVVECETLEQINAELTS